uniref:(northern house mosquito) hypothetical protein n=1 Tax=Culex pipiens TaxID=7175 RepID=A0A8D8F514_CULPI
MRDHHAAGLLLGGQQTARTGVSGAHSSFGEESAVDVAEPAGSPSGHQGPELPVPVRHAGAVHEASGDHHRLHREALSQPKGQALPRDGSEQKVPTGPGRGVDPDRRLLRLRSHLHALARGADRGWCHSEPIAAPQDGEGAPDGDPADGRTGDVRVLEQPLQGAPHRVEPGEGRRSAERVAEEVLR